MTSIDSFDTRQRFLRKRFEAYEKDTTKPEHSTVCQLFRMYDDSMSWFYAESRSDGPELDQWDEQIKFAGIKAHGIYNKLKGRGVDVAYCKRLLENRRENCGSGPERLEFHLHYNSIEELLNFCIIGTTDSRELAKMRKAA